jgi:SAM-dependent methyltransferase
MFRLEDKHWWFVARRNLVTQALKQQLGPTNSQKPHILDVGCGTGGTMDRLREWSCVTGLDLEPYALEFCKSRRHDDLILGSATEMPFESNKFDAAVALDVLEHIPDHVSAAQEILRVLKPGGTLVVTVPAYQSLWSGHDVALHHQRRYRAEEMQKLLADAGFDVVHLTYTVSALFPLVWLVRRAQNIFKKNAPPKADAVVTPEPFNSVLLALLNAEGNFTLKKRLPFGLTVFAIAKKKHYGTG